MKRTGEANRSTSRTGRGSEGRNQEYEVEESLQFRLYAESLPDDTGREKIERGSSTGMKGGKEELDDGLFNEKI